MAYAAWMPNTLLRMQVAGAVGGKPKFHEFHPLEAIRKRKPDIIIDKSNMHLLKQAMGL